MVPRWFKAPVWIFYIEIVFLFVINSTVYRKQGRSPNDLCIVLYLVMCKLLAVIKLCLSEGIGRSVIQKPLPSYNFNYTGSIDNICLVCDPWWHGEYDSLIIMWKFCSNKIKHFGMLWCCFHSASIFYCYDNSHYTITQNSNPQCNPALVTI